MSIDELRTLIERHARNGTSTAIEGVLVSRVEEPVAPAASMSGTILAIIAQGTKRLALGDRVLEYRAGQYLVASVDLPVTGHFIDASLDHPALGFGLVLRPQVIASLLLEHRVEHRRGARGEPAPPGIAVSDASDELIDAAVRMLRLLDHPRDIPVLAPMIEREILWRLVTGEQGATVRQLGLADSNLARVSHALEWLRDHHAEPVRVDELADMSGMSVSAFHRNFRAVASMSPIQFQKQIRLQEARLLLVTSLNDVAGAGYAVGYDSPSQFSREYRRQFGTSPGRDATLLRAPPSLAPSAIP
jgi:AraC-like DNA-binding protein